MADAEPKPLVPESFQPRKRRGRKRKHPEGLLTRAALKENRRLHLRAWNERRRRQQPGYKPKRKQYLGRRKSHVLPLAEDAPPLKREVTVEDREHERKMLERIAALRVTGMIWKDIIAELGFEAYQWAVVNRRERWTKIMEAAWLEKADELRAKAEDRLDSLGAGAEEDKVRCMAANAQLQHVDRIRGQTIRLTVDRTNVGIATDAARVKLDELMPQELDGAVPYPSEEESVRLLDGTVEQGEKVSQYGKAEAQEAAEAAPEGGVSPAETPEEGTAE